jgi:hypothetical protein
VTRGDPVAPLLKQQPKRETNDPEADVSEAGVLEPRTKHLGVVSPKVSGQMVRSRESPLESRNGEQQPSPGTQARGPPRKGRAIVLEVLQYLKRAYCIKLITIQQLVVRRLLELAARGLDPFPGELR